MAKKYDVVMKELVERDPAAWLALLGIKTKGPIGIVNTDLSAFSSDADKILLIKTAKSHLVHMEFQSTRDYTLPKRLLRYNVNIGHAQKKMVRSYAILLHPRADFSKLTGVHEESVEEDDPILAFYYRVVRAWTLPVEPLLTGAIWVMPLAAAADAPREDLPEIVRLVDSRLSRETEPSSARIIMEMTLVLAGLRLDKSTIQYFRQGLKTMTELKESSYYKLVHGEGLVEGRKEGRKEGLEKGLKQGLEKGRKEGRREGLEEGLEKGLEKGKITGARTILLRLGEVRFGKPDKSIRAAIEAIDDLDRLEKLTERILSAKSWRELIAIDLSERN